MRCRQPSATSDLWLRDSSEVPAVSGKSQPALSELFGALKPLPDTSLPSRHHGTRVGPIPSLPPLPQLPPPPNKNKSLGDICHFYSNSITGRDASVQPLESEPAFFFRTFADTDAPPPLSEPQMLPAPSLPRISRALLSSPLAADPPAAGIWRDARVLLAPPPPLCEPCALSPLLSMLPSGIMTSGACFLQLYTLTRAHTHTLSL